MITKKDFKAIAEIVQRACEDNGNREFPGDKGADFIKSGLVKRLADYFKSDNPRFNTQKFIDACYGIDKKG